MNDWPCQVSITPDALRNNYHFLKTKHPNLMPVIKADAYGHGLIEVAQILEEEGARRFAVGTATEGARLRKNGFKGEVVILLGAHSLEECAIIKEYNLLPLVHSWQGIEYFQDTPLKIAIKIDSGMGRLGFRLEELEDVARKLQGKKAIPSMALSHFAVADMPQEKEYTLMQLHRMQEGVSLLKAYFPEIQSSFGNSAIILSMPENAGEIARPGVALYGGNPFHNTKNESLGNSLQDSMSVSTPILTVHPLYAGESLGYGRTYIAESDKTIAWMSMGYADMYRRNANIQGQEVCIQGQRCPVIARVAMQMTAIDVSNLSTRPREGDMVYVLGGEANPIKLHEISDAWGSIPYEVLCLFGTKK